MAILTLLLALLGSPSPAATDAKAPCCDCCTTCPGCDICPAC